MNTQNRVGLTILSECAREGISLVIVQDLIYFGADVNLCDIEGNTALHGAASTGHHLQGELLINAGINIHKVNDYGNSALHNSAMHGHVPFTVMLLNHGVDYQRKNHSGQSPLYCSMLHQRYSTAELLHTLGASLSQNESMMYEKYEASRSESKEMFYERTLALATQPRSLKSWSRIVIRQNVEKPLVAFPLLPIPKSFQDFLLLSEYNSHERNGGNINDE